MMAALLVDDERIIIPNGRVVTVRRSLLQVRSAPQGPVSIISA
jgi:hypothetical protein